MRRAVGAFGASALCLALLANPAQAVVIREYPIGSWPFRLALGPDGALWFTEIQDDRIGRFAPPGTLSEFGLPRPGSSPQGIVAGPDGNLWFTEYLGQAIGRITPTGTITEFALPT